MLLGLGIVVCGASLIVAGIVGPSGEDWFPFLFYTGIVALFPAVWAIEFGGRLFLKTKATYLTHEECVRFVFRQPGYAEKVSEFHLGATGRVRTA